MPSQVGIVDLSTRRFPYQKGFSATGTQPFSPTLMKGLG
jgi:hypothetical protein